MNMKRLAMLAVVAMVGSFAVVTLAQTGASSESSAKGFAIENSGSDSALLLALRPHHDDSDGDGIVDADDNCPSSDLSSPLTIDGCRTRTPNVVDEFGCSLADHIADCAATAANHDDFVSCVADLAAELRAERVITQRQETNINICAKNSSLP
ncbi:MAG TPA: hypothetical protein VKK81_06215 [Candidatus Binatia bacterium]|nr:hypothetical protein [Candidatus Binatia bacterium]